MQKHTSLLRLITQSHVMWEHVESLIDATGIEFSEREHLSLILCSVSVEHWKASLRVLEGGMLPSAITLQRSQYEGLVRAVWCHLAASDTQFKKLNNPLTLQTERDAKNLPGVHEMLKVLQHKSDPNLFSALIGFKEGAWLALNSYVHSGIHAVHQHNAGYPALLLEQTLKNGNLMLLITAIQVAMLSGRGYLQSAIWDCAHQYSECLPPKN